MPGQICKNVLLTLLTACFSLPLYAKSDRIRVEADAQKLEKFQETVSGEPIILAPMSVEKPVRIALIYPSADISDFWTRNYTALKQRLVALELPFEISEFTSRQIEHSLQTQYTEQVLNSETPYDFVIFGPSELGIQASNIQKLSASKDFKTFIWAFHTPNEQWKHLDTSEVFPQLTHKNSTNSYQVTIRVEGMYCSACGWLLQKVFSKRDGVLDLRINTVTQNIQIDFID